MRTWATAGTWATVGGGPKSAEKVKARHAVRRCYLGAEGREEIPGADSTAVG
jgi:hypothetical protein